jgi:hypothetical protein
MKIIGPDEPGTDAKETEVILKNVFVDRNLKINERGWVMKV